MNAIEQPFFLDTNILVYAHKSDEGEKHRISKKIVEECMEKRQTLAISNQVLGEFCRVMLYKADNPAPKEKVLVVMEAILRLDSWKKITYNAQTVFNALQSNESIFIWDAVIAQTMLENGITKIYTENEKDFEKIKGIKAVNPFK